MKIEQQTKRNKAPKILLKLKKMKLLKVIEQNDHSVIDFSPVRKDRLRYDSSESLILAQDERWRRA